MRTPPGGLGQGSTDGAPDGLVPDEGPDDDGGEAPVERCPYADPNLWIVNRSTGDAFPLRCGRNSCLFCLPRNAARRARALRYVAPQRFLTLTQVGEDWPTVRARMKRWVYGLRGEGFDLEVVWSVEPNPAGTGHHVHAWQRGAYLPQDAVARVADRNGMGAIADIRKWVARPGGEGYGLKGVGYGLKGATATETQGAFMENNGRRLTHQTRGWWCDPATGELLGARGAERAASRAENGGAEWTLERR